MQSDQIVKQVIAQLLDVDESSLTPDRPLTAIEGWDSVNALRVLIYLERQLGISIDYDRFMKAEHIGDLTGLTQAETGTGAEVELAS